MVYLKVIRLKQQAPGPELDADSIGDILRMEV